MFIGTAALVLAIEAATVLPQPQPIAMNDGIAVFTELCLEGFPDPARAAQARANEALGLVLVPKPAAMAQQPGERWTSERFELSYADADWLPRDLPSPQCAVTFSIPEQRNHLSLAQEVGSIFPSAKGKLGKDKPRGLSRWDMQPSAGLTFRAFLETQAGPDRTQVSLRLLNLRN